jgi:hypothetical protein
MTKQYEITVKILVTVPDDNSLGMNADQWAGKIAGDWANMALTYRNIGADEVVEVTAKECEND